MTSQGSPILEIPMVWVYGVVPLSAAMMFIHLATNFLRRTRLQLVDIGPILIAILGLWFFMNHVDMKTYVYWVMTGALCVFLLTNMPISIAMGLTTLVGLWVSGFPDVQLINRMIGGLNNFTLLAVPLFILTGAIMATGSLAKRLFEFANACVGWIRGGLGLSNLTVSTLFADISGSAVADTAAVGSVMIPNMVRRGYDVNFTTALQASAGTLGMMIPPSITMILYAWVTGVSTATLFLASFLPAFVVVISFAIVIYVTAIRRGYPKEERFRLSEFLRTGRESFFALFAPVVIMGGIVGGIFTATEAGAVACVYCFLITALIYRELTWTSFVDMLIETASQVGRMTFMVATAIGMSWIIIVNQGPQQLAGAIQDITQDPFLVLLILNVVLIILGTFLEPASTLLIVVPVILPLLATVGIDPVVFGVIFTINCALGMLTPPVGLCLFVACQISGAKMESAFMAMIPFMLIMCADLVILSFWPQIALIVPQLLGMY
jgi:C4-dicarboxylate transporter DctM subunit